MTPWNRDIAAYPAAILSTPSVESDELSNGENLRTYLYEILFIVNGDDVPSVDYVEELMDAIFTEFDTNFTLGGVADGGVAPAMTQAVPVITAGDQSKIIFSINIHAKESVTIQ